MVFHVVLYRTRGTQLFTHGKGKGWYWLVLNIVPRKFGVYIQFGE